MGYSSNHWSVAAQVGSWVTIVFVSVFVFRFLQWEGGQMLSLLQEAQLPLECSSTGGQLGDNWGTLETRGVASHLYYTLYYNLYFPVLHPVFLCYTLYYSLFPSGL